MKKVLRAIVWREDQETDKAKENLGKVRIELLTALSLVETKVLEEILFFYEKFGEAPDGNNIYSHFEKTNQPEELVYLEEVFQQPFTSGASFDQLLSEQIEEQAAKRLIGVCKRAVKIATAGETIGKNVVKGVDNAVNFLFSEVQGTPKEKSGLAPGLKQASDDLDALYNSRKTNPRGSYGVGTGYALIDTSTAGIRRKQLYIHAGFPGHCKSTFIMNMMLNAAVGGGWNSILFTSEMPAPDVMFMLVAMHSADPKFKGIGNPLNSRGLILGQVSAADEKFFKEVKEDLVSNKDYGSIRVVDSGEFSTFGSITQRTIREHGEEEVDMVWVDYITRLPIDTKYAKISVTEARNETIADAKRFAMGFDRGRGVAVGSAFQINREGFKRARDAGGKMDKTALAQYNAAEKEADVISYVFYGDEEVAVMEPKLGLMKSRWGDTPTDPVSTYIEPSSRRIFDIASGMLGGTPVPSAQEEDTGVEL